jgi:hypothetical protein
MTYLWCSVASFLLFLTKINYFINLFFYCLLFFIFHDIYDVHIVFYAIFYDFWRLSSNGCSSWNKCSLKIFIEMYSCRALFWRVYWTRWCNLILIRILGLGAVTFLTLKNMGHAIFYWMTTGQPKRQLN